MSGEEFRELSPIRAGGQAKVWRAVQVGLDRRVALKIVHPWARDRRVAAEARETSPDAPTVSSPEAAEPSCYRQATLAEARITAFLDHPNIVPIYALDQPTSGGVGRIAMKLIEGTPWDEMLCHEWGSVGQLEYLIRHSGILATVARAVAFAHERGVAHRDLKASQVIVESTDRVYLCDWGHAAIFDWERASEFTEARRGELPSTDAQPSPHGTPRFFAPEQLDLGLGRTGPWTDVFLLGEILFLLLYGRSLRGSTGVRHEATEEERRGVPGELAALVDKALVHAPGARVLGASEFAAGIEDWLTGQGGRRTAALILAEVRERVDSFEGIVEFTALSARLDEAMALHPTNGELPSLRDALFERRARQALAAGDVDLCSQLAARVGNPGRRGDLERGIAAARKGSALRRRAATASLVLALLAAVIGIAVVVRANERIDASRLEAEEARRVAEADRQRAEAAGHAAQMLNVGTALGEGNLARARHLLLSSPPGKAGWEWQYLMGRAHPESRSVRIGRTLATLKVTEGGGAGVCLGGEAGSSPYRMVLVDLRTGRIRWEREAPQLPATKRGGPTWVADLGLSPDGELVAGPAPGGSVVVLATATGELVARLAGEGGGREFTSICLVGTRAAARVLAGSDDEVAHDGSITRASDRIARIWEVPSGRLIARCEGHGGGITDVALSPDGEIAATACRDGGVRVFDAATGRLLWEAGVSGGSPWRVLFLDQGRRIASAGGDGVVRIWGARDGRLVTELHAHTSTVTWMGLSPDGSTLATCSLDGTAALWSMPSGDLRAHLTGHLWWAWSGAFSSDGRLFATFSLDRTARVWDVASGALVKRMTGSVDLLRAGGFAADGKELVMGCNAGVVLVADVASEDWALEIRQTGGSSLARVGYSADGSRFGVARTDQASAESLPTSRGHCEVYDARTGARLARFGAGGVGVRDVTLSEDGSIVLLGCDEGSVVVGRVSDETTRTLMKRTAPTARALLLAGGTRALIGWQDGAYGVYSVDTGLPVWSAEPKLGINRDAGLMDIALSPDGRVAAISNSESKVTIVDVVSGDVVGRVGRPESPSGKGLRALVQAVFVPRSDLLATLEGSRFGGETISVWRWRQNELVTVLRPESYDARGVSVSPDGRCLAIGEREGTVRIWSTESWREVLVLRAHSESGDRVAWTAFDPGGLGLLTSGRDGTSRLWRGLPQELRPLEGEDADRWEARLQGWQWTGKAAR